MLLLSTRFHVEDGFDRGRFMLLAERSLASSESQLRLGGCGWNERDDTELDVTTKLERAVINNYDDAFVFQAYRLVDGGKSGMNEYITTCVLRDRDERPSMYVGVELESQELSMDAGRGGFELPRVLKSVFWDEAGGLDRGLLTEDRPFVVRKTDVQTVQEILKDGCQGLVNPIVYVSVDDDGKPGMDCIRLSGELAGQAHVLQAASPVVSAQMAAFGRDAGIEIPVGGSAAIFLPGTKSKTVRPGKKVEDEIRDLVRDMLCRLSVPDAYSVSRIRNAHLLSKLGGDADLSKLFDDILKEKDAEIEHMREENDRLRQSLARSRGKAESLKNGLEKSESQEGGKFITLAVTERDLYDGELKDVVLKALESVRSGMDGNSTLTRCRKYHVLADVLEHNFPCPTGTSLVDCVRSAFEDGTLTREGIGRLRSAGFVVEKDGRQSHWKLRYGDDERYTGTFGATPSDKARAAKNFVSEFTNLLFGY